LRRLSREQVLIAQGATIVLAATTLSLASGLMFGRRVAAHLIGTAVLMPTVPALSLLPLGIRYRNDRFKKILANGMIPLPPAIYGCFLLYHVAEVNPLYSLVPIALATWMVAFPIVRRQEMSVTLGEAKGTNQVYGILHRDYSSSSSRLRTLTA
jgi:hypothetical protein